MIKKTVKRTTCRGCNGKNLKMFFDMGSVPLAGGYLKKGKTGKELKLPLKVWYCRDCGLVQILDIVDPSVLFKKYFYASSTIKSLINHFTEYRSYLKKNFLKKPKNSLLEFGSNDGILLKLFSKDKNITCVGIDPSENVSALAKKNGCDVHVGYFNTDMVPFLYKKYGKFDVITGSNVFAHTDNIGEILQAVDLLLKEDGHFIVEVHYLLDLIEKNQFDNIYHEHLSHYSLTALKNIYARYGLKLVDFVHLDMHGGAIRAIAVKESSKHKESNILKKYLEKEKILTPLRLLEFKETVETQKEKLLSTLKEIVKNKKTIVGYGASGRGTILLNYCKIDKKYLKYIVDASPLRQNILMPGVHIPVYSPEKLRKKPSDYVFVIAWSYFDSIIEQEKALRKKGVKFIQPLPSVRIV